MIRKVITASLRILDARIKLLGSFIRHQHLTFPPFVSSTLDMDDVKIAKKWLKGTANYENPSIVSEFEKKFAEWNGSRYAFAFMAGRIALSACIYALELNKDDEVILPGYTCVVVPNSFHFEGVKTVYSDIELDTYGLDASLIEEKITTKTKAILLHHLYGLVCRDYERILEIAKKHNLKVIEDCAHSTGAVYQGRRVGSYGDMAFYSSEHSKVFSTIMGGIAVTNDDEIAKRLREFHEQAPLPHIKDVQNQLYNIISDYYINKHPLRWLLSDVIKISNLDRRITTTTDEELTGIKPINYGARMPAPVAALGINQIQKIDNHNIERRNLAKRWDEWCDQNGYKKPLVLQESIPVYLRYPVMVEEEKKDDTSWAVNQLGVQLGVWFVSNVHPADWFIEGCPNANKAVRQCVNFPTSG